MSKYIGDVSAYAYAVSKGYTGTEEEFAELMASYADVGQTAVDAKDAAVAAKTAAQTAATTATNKASEATTAAQTATTKAGEAQTSAQTASSKASEASQSASTASQKATEASQSATNASQSAQTAEQAKTASQTAQGLAESARDSAISAKDDAESARDEAQDIVAGINAKAEQIDQNTTDITELKNDGVAPSAEQLLSKNMTADAVPYLFRKTGGDGADREYVDAIVGGTVAWNQMCPISGNAGKTITKDGIDFTYNADGSITLNGTSTARGQDNRMPVGADIGTLIPNHVYFIRNSPVGGSANTFYGGVAGIVVDTGNGGLYKHTYAWNTTQLRFDYYSGVTFNNAKIYSQYIDLTQALTPTIADYIYSLEQTTAGAGVTFFKSLFPKDYYPYNTGELKSVEGVSAHVMRDADSNIIGNYPLDNSLTLRGIPKLSDGKMYFDGDRYLPDGTVTRKYGIVDLGSLTWEQTDTELHIFRTSVLTNHKLVSGINVLCPGYTPVNASLPGANMADKTCKTNQSNSGILYVRDTSYASTVDFKAAMSGVYLVYELATPTTEQAEPYQHLQQCDPNGTEEFVSTGIVPVGHETRYPDNLRAKIDGLPWDFSSLIAPTEKTTTASRNYTTGSLLIMDNTLYKVTANIANGGTITPNTNVTATTLSEILSALAQ